MDNIIFVIILPIATFVLGWAAGIYLPEKFRKEDRTPRISIGPFQDKHGYNYFDITNHSGDILNLSIEIFWLQDGTRQSRVMEKFGNSNDNIYKDRPFNCNTVKKGETKKVYECPIFSDEGIVDVIIKGEDVTGKKYKETFVLKNKLKK